MKNKYRKIVVKIGTNVITGENGLLDINVIENIVFQIAELKKQKIEVIVVSSGAMGAGRSLIKLSEKSNDVVRRQILASVGQPRLIHTYSELFSGYGYFCAQILATKEDFRDRIHYLNMRNCFFALLQDNIIPIVNENDVVSVTELMFTDNDELAGLIASMMNVDALVILTNVDGIFDGNPADKSSRLISVINPDESSFRSYISPEKSQFGRGGMITKCGIAHKMSLVGITTHIVNGKTKNILLDINSQKNYGTKFLPKKDTSNVKKWIAHSEGFEKGTIYINEGAQAALLLKDKAVSLLPVGIINIEGDFEKGDIVKICNQKKQQVGLGLAQYSSQRAKQIAGQKGHKPLIHYDYLFLKSY